MDVTKEAIEKILSLSQPTVVNIGGREYCDRALTSITPPLAGLLLVQSLSGLCTYLNSNRDGLNIGTDEITSDLMVWVESPTQVTVIGALDPKWRKRETFICAKYQGASSFRFDHFMGQEEFCLGLQVGFMPSSDRDDLQRVAGHLTAENSITVQDDGVSQNATLKNGVVMRVNEAIRSRWALTPFSTWPEIAQPEKNYIFRLKKSESGPLCALFEVDDPQWKVKAMNDTRDYLQANLPPGVVVIS